jgi:transposase
MSNLKAYKYRLYPHKKQAEQLQWVVDHCRELYNSALQERRDAYEMMVKRHPNYYDETTRKLLTQEHALTYNQQATQLPEVKAIRPEYNEIHSQVLQDVLRRVDKAYKAFFRRIKVGIDLGLVHFATLSDESTIENPRHLRQAENKLKKLQEALARKKRGSKRRRKAAQHVGKTHRHIRNQRKDFHHKEARKLVTRYQTTVFEKLQPANMSKRPKPKQDEATGQYLPNGASAKAGLNKSILDAGWSMFQQIVESKAACAGSRVLLVSPKYTSQICSGCGALVSKTLEERWHECSCGCSLDRDHNAALNILRLGLQALEQESRARTERSEDAPLRSPRR